MNTKEIGEIRRRQRRDRSNMTAIYGCYVNAQKEIVTEYRQSTGMMSENEAERYFGLMKRTLSGTLGKNLVEICRQACIAAKAKGVKCYVGSAAPRLNVDFVWGEAQLDDKLDGCVCGDDVVNFKPHPEIFLTCCERMGLNPEECVVFEDAEAGIEAAKRAGIKVVALATTFSREFLSNTDADAIVDDFRDVTIDMLRNLVEA